MGSQLEVTHTAKHTDPACLALYGEAMSESVKYKRQFFAPAIRKYLPVEQFSVDRPCLILDLGSCTSALARDLVQDLPPYFHFIENDLDRNFLYIAREGVKEDGNETSFSHVQANAVQLPFQTASIDAVMHSSFFHEIFSFPVTGKGPFNFENCSQVVREISRIVRPGGYVFGRDYVARPQDAEEVLRVETTDYDGKTILDTAELLRTPINELSNSSKVARFLMEFEPARKWRSMNAGETKYLPAWLVSELLFHLNYTCSDAMWSSEIYEQYGDLSESEIHALALVHGFEPIQNDAVSHYDVAEGKGLNITNLKGEIVNTRDRFPTNTYLIWRKK
ncbi:hypothetical protein COY16_02390 [Candidatus Roizmanbacteria bacterium CG_4_10_14_0_2_um_filter_39_13]|uniref:Methyltransferase type 11 domain-containing protein n=1 Tax=Candidatus Roizmanbacteria bacterium CG_4_10_14_0_2_um_filter_39_13 TaxID=1974825 RepID=A0A2M7TZQ6_9BACT|nr:MAG: hypothetical protein COY16_02390 [Candidatus Roizmanbacteria bacterium CG_4_10_14_0_2_um_filter_39_13]